MLENFIKSLSDSPTIDYCEKAVGGLIARPGYAISNLAYIFTGIYIFLKYRNNSKLSKLGLITLLI